MRKKSDDPKECQDFQNDGEIIDAIRSAGMPLIRARECLYKKLIRMVYSLLLDQRYFKETPAPDQQNEANDVFLTVFNRLYEAAAKPGWAVEAKLSTYLYQSFRNEISYRGKKAGKKAPLPPEPPPPALKKADAEHLRTAIMHLGHPCNTILVREFEGYTSHEIAQMEPSLGIDAARVRRKKMDCLKRLHDLLHNPNF